MESSLLLERVQGLTDLELAILLSLVAGQHCMIQSEKNDSDSLEQELQLITSNVFGLTHSVLNCNVSTTAEEFCDGVLVESATYDNMQDDDLGNGLDSEHCSSRGSRSRNSVEVEGGERGQSIANIIIVTGLSEANEQIQIQALELLRTKRMFTHTAVHAAPKMFLLVFLTDASGPPLVRHLNDHIFISHYHDPEDGFANLEEGSEWVEDDRASQSSVVHRSVVPDAMFTNRQSNLGQEEVGSLRDLSDSVMVSAEVKVYMHNVITFLRMHRAVAGGVSPQATKHFDLLVRCLAPLHGLDFVTPSLVSLAARKIYPHRIAITSPENERSMQYGSDLAAVSSILAGLRPEDVIEDVLQQLETPL